jgi:hypothetical protein
MADQVTALEEFLLGLVAAVCPRAYHERARDEQVYPYVVTSLTYVTGDQSTDTWQFEVDIWGTARDRSAVGALSDELNQVLNHSTHVMDTSTVSLWTQSQQPIGDDRDQVVRRHIVYEVHTIS